MRPKPLSIAALFVLFAQACLAQDITREPKPSSKPSKYQQAQIARKYGMFIHFGINTFHDEEWTDGSKPAETYRPDTVDADQWIRTALEAGMKYVILVTKHVDGFCMWNSQYTDYDIANSGNQTNVVEAVARACKKYGIALGLYYSMWDRHQNGHTLDTTLDRDYNKYMVNQIRELITITNQYTPVVELWLDAGWEKQRSRWPIAEIYETVKGMAPQCQVGVNWSIGRPDNPDPDSAFLLPTLQKQGYPIRYFPSDFRMGDPYMPANPDPKLFEHNRKLYYMPWETTICLSQKWFYNTKDTVYKTPEELFDIYKKATAQDNILILDLPPDRSGRLREKDRQIVFSLQKLIEADQKK
ncbi:MAG: calcium:sodium exchange protein [Bacteroidetes bacterium]|nr:MAG: calcium:sodium exchange protein [Bacteroidota bacterium]